MFSLIDRVNGLAYCAITPNRRRRRTAPERFADTGIPSTNMSPCVRPSGCESTMRFNQRRRVNFPDFEGPSITVSLCLGLPKSTSHSTCSQTYHAHTDLSSTSFPTRVNNLGRTTSGRRPINEGTQFPSDRSRSHRPSFRWSLHRPVVYTLHSSAQADESEPT